MEMLNRQNLRANLDKIYEKLNFMESAGRLVSNSKVLHFLFPYLLIPMDRNNTLMYLYNNTSESKEKYLEIIDMSIELIQGNIHWIKYLDNNWNTTLPKMIDNAIIILVGKSLKNKSA
jgi:hypothetical protein